MKKNFILISILILSILFCKKIKEQELNDPQWRAEFLEISNSICVKLESCVQDDFSKIKKNLQSFARSEIKSEKCSEKSKKSRVYLLKGADPLKMKQVAKDCYSQIQKYSCEEIKSGVIQTNNTCEDLRKMQQALPL